MNKERGKKKNTQRLISISWWIYAIIVIVVLILLFAGFYLHIKLLKEIAISLLGSFLVSLMIDMGNTRATKLQDEKGLEILKADTKGLCMKLDEELKTRIEFFFYFPRGEYTIKSLINTVFINTDDQGLLQTQINSMISISGDIVHLSESFRKMYDIIQIMTNSIAVSDELRTQIQKNINCTERFIQDSAFLDKRRGEMQSVEKLKKELLEIIDLSHHFSSESEEKWSEGNWNTGTDVNTVSSVQYG